MVLFAGAGAHRGFCLLMKMERFGLHPPREAPAGAGVLGPVCGRGAAPLPVLGDSWDQRSTGMCPPEEALQLSSGGPRAVGTVEKLGT